ncbi:two-component system, sporulation sensor kinase A [Fictibacillus solisalsi]|uniref:histidine kinase n=1 Tax=Fictibacillus solisalsi TaxID=459525 RepID=A0A1G9WKN3_9BACL|nr:ATP-binding protein [Fictibacillus solisalsi]SDM85108.1 two-component system, sporulation sensor kinase A [Fictibacillus solisalsi]
MKKVGQLSLISLSIAFTTYQKIWSGHPFWTFDFFLFTFIAWLIGWHYDKIREFAKQSKANEEGYKLLIDTLPESILIHQNGKILYLNQPFLQLINLRNMDAAIGNELNNFVGPPLTKPLLNAILLEESKFKPVDIEIKNKKGISFFYEVSSYDIKYGNKDVSLTVIKDITLKKEETRILLQRSEALALLGQMAAGIAHEIRNPLTSISGFIQLLQVNQHENQYIAIVESELERINNIVGDFLDLSKPKEVALKEQNIEHVLKEVIALLNLKTKNHNIQITEQYESNLPDFYIDKNQMKQVFLNLLKNSMEAMPNGGQIKIVVNKGHHEQVLITIKDEGVGIPKEQLSILGQPFITTKENGTGLGLLICYKIIESHKGTLKVDSKVNEGTTVSISMPVSIINERKLNV